MRTTSALLIALFLGACGGSTAELSQDDRAREDDSLMVRGYHDDVVRMAGDAEAGGGAMPLSECERFCADFPQVSDRTDRICAIAGRDDRDEATQFLCEDARSRTEAMSTRGAECACE